MSEMKCPFCSDKMKFCEEETNRTLIGLTTITRYKCRECGFLATFMKYTSSEREGRHD